LDSRHKKNLCLIPAKGGSIRLARKNVVLLGGKPLLAWAVEAALQCKLMTKVIVSTEDEQIAAAARSFGAETPFMRPEHLACDPAGVVDVALHAIAEMRRQGEEYDTLVILLPTCPFRTAEDIVRAFKLYGDSDARFLMSISQYDHTPFAAMALDAKHRLLPYFPNYIGMKSQAMPKAYRANGAIHILNIQDFERERSYYAQPLIGYEMPWQRSIDIDTEQDLLFAESLMKS
jgi:CMP-N-acetylneuraminic acid synthetase